MDMTFPIVVKMSEKARNELHACEFGSYEDVVVSKNTPSRFGGRHICELIEEQKRKTDIVLESQTDVDEVYYSVCSGTFQIDDPTPGEGKYYYKTACRIADQLRPFATPSLVAEWARPSGL